jgi:hypothetical protein
MATFISLRKNLPTRHGYGRNPQNIGAAENCEAGISAHSDTFRNPARPARPSAVPMTVVYRNLKWIAGRKSQHLPHGICAAIETAPRLPERLRLIRGNKQRL